MSAPAFTLEALRGRYGPRYRWLLLLAVMVGNVAFIMCSTIINVAIPDMSQHFSLRQERAQWVSSGFMIAMTVGMLTMPWLLGRFGYRRLYAGSMLLLLSGGLAGGLATDFTVVLVSRLVQGLAAGVVQPVPPLIILRAFEPDEQGRATGLYGMGVILAPALAPSVGGVLVDVLGWRSIFFLVAPFCLVCLWLVHRYLPHQLPADTASPRQRLDWRGLLLGGLGTVLLLNGFVELQHGAAGAVLLLAGAAAFTAFIAWQMRLMARGGQPLMNLSVFRFRTFAISSVVGFIYGAALFGSTYLLPVYMQLALGLSASMVGLILLPPGLVLALTLVGAGRLADRYPSGWLVSLGVALLAASFALMPTVGLDTSLWWLGAWITLGRVGLGFILPSLNLSALRSLDKPLMPQGSSAINFIRILGGASGVSLCAILLEWRIAAHGDSLNDAATSTARLAAFNEAFLVLAFVCGLALLAALQLRGKRQ